jgi:hypothetical protein
MHTAILQEITIDNKYLKKKKNMLIPTLFSLSSAISPYHMISPRLKEYRTAKRSTPVSVL